MLLPLSEAEDRNDPENACMFSVRLFGDLRVGRWSLDRPNGLRFGDPCGLVILREYGKRGATATGPCWGKDDKQGKFDNISKPGACSSRGLHL